MIEDQGIGKISPSGVVTQYQIPGCCGYITAGSDGNLWATGGPGIVKIATDGTVIDQYATCPCGPLIQGPDGNLWFSCWEDICKMTPAGSVSEFAAVDVGQMIAGPDGNVSYLETSRGNIVRITTGGVTTEYSLPSLAATSSFIPPQSSIPVGITQGPDGNLWFTEQASNKIGVFNMQPPPLPNCSQR